MRDLSLATQSLFAVLLVASLLGCGRSPAGLSNHVVAVGDRKVVLSLAEWRVMPNEAEYARNFEAVSNRSPRQYQIVTVFLNQMSRDRKTGQEIAPNEYLEVFLSNPDEITVLLQRDHGSYWLLSREMFRGVTVPGVDTSRLGSLSASESELVAEALRNEIDSTRHLLGEQLLSR